MKNLDNNILYDHSLIAPFVHTTVRTLPCADSGVCAKYANCSTHHIHMPSVSFRTGYSSFECLSVCTENVYSYIGSPSFIVYDSNPKLINNYSENFPEKWEINYNYSVCSHYNPNINNAFPHPSTYHLLPDHKYPVKFLVDDALLFFSRKSFVVLKSNNNNYYYLWVTDYQNGDYLIDPVLKVDISKEINIIDSFIVGDLNSDNVYKFFVNDDDINNIILDKVDVTNQHKKGVIIDRTIIPDYVMKVDANYLTEYIFKYSSIHDKITFELFTDDTDIRSYHNRSINMGDLESLVTQRMKFDEHYKKHVNHICINFSNNTDGVHSVYPLFKLFDTEQNFDNVEINEDFFNKDLPFETPYAYVIRSDFKIIAKRKLVNCDSIHYRKNDKNVIIEIGNRNFFNTKYINSSNYCDVFVDLLIKDIEYYLVIANEDFYSRNVDFINYYRYIAFDYTDTRHNDFDSVDSNTSSKCLLEFRKPIYPSGVKYIDYNIIFADGMTTIDNTGYKTNHYMTGICGYKTKCANNTYVYVIFSNNDKGYISYKNKGYDFGEYIINKVVDDPILQKTTVTYLLSNAFIRYVTTHFNLSCGEIEFLCWNRPLNVVNIMQDVSAVGKYTENKSDPLDYWVNEKVNIYSNGTTLSMVDFTEYFRKNHQLFGEPGTISQVSTSINTFHNISGIALEYEGVFIKNPPVTEPKFLLTSILGTDIIDKYVYKGKLQAEYTPGKHCNFMLNRNNILHYPHSGLYEPHIYYVNITSSIEPDATIMEVNNVKPYRPFELGYKIKHHCTNDIYPIVARYLTRDNEQHLLPLTTISCAVRSPAFVSTRDCCHNGLKYSDQFHYELFMDTRGITRYEGIDSSSSTDLIFQSKQEFVNRIAPHKKFESSEIVTDFINLCLYLEEDFSTEFGEGQLYELSKSPKLMRMDTYPHRYCANGQQRNIIYFTTFNIYHTHIHQLLCETIDFYSDNIRYMQGRLQAVISNGEAINIKQMQHQRDSTIGLDYKKEFSIRSTYVNYTHSYIDRILFTIDTHDLLAFNHVYDKLESAFYNINQEVQKIPLYEFNFINTTIAKHIQKV